MVTLITEKLQDQTLDEVSITETVLGEQPKTNSLERSNFGTVRRSSGGHHERNNTNFVTRSQTCEQDGCNEGGLTSSFFTTRCLSCPPAKKRLCRSRSDSYEGFEGSMNWSPEPSSIWTPVEQKKAERMRVSGARSLDFSKENFTWSTPPESPISRPVSANSNLKDWKFFPLKLINEESDNTTAQTTENIGLNREYENTSDIVPRRSHSHPSFSQVLHAGLKRRLSEVDIPRPALDFDKMKARCFTNKNVDKRNLKSSKYNSKRHPSLSPKASQAFKCEKILPAPNTSSDFGSSLLITPTASPTGEMRNPEAEKCCTREDENANTKLSTSMGYLPFTGPHTMMETELDLNLIEEDGTLNNSQCIPLCSLVRDVPDT